MERCNRHKPFNEKLLVESNILLTLKNKIQKNTTHLWLSISPLALAACGGGGSNPDMGTEEEGMGDSNTTSTTLSNTAAGFDVNAQFNLMSVFTAPVYKVCTEGPT